MSVLEPCLPGAGRPGAASEWAELVPAVPGEWFLRPESAGGIHGIGHTRRVGVHVLRLCVALDVPEPARDLALAAARWHDLGRRHDGVEPEHGAGSVARVRELGLADELVRAGELSPAGLELVFFAVRHHSLDDEAGRRSAARLGGATHGDAAAPSTGDVADDKPDGGRRDRTSECGEQRAGTDTHDVRGGARTVTADTAATALEILWLLKDADALDRVRLSLHGDVDARYFRHPRAAGFVDFAWELLAVV